MSKDRLQKSDFFQKISVRSEDFDLGVEYQELTDHSQNCGAVVFFCGRVRPDNLSSHSNHKVSSINIEHYPNMAETVITDIVGQAGNNFKLLGVTVIHRIGQLKVGEQIVFIGVTSYHRLESFRACEYIIDNLKIHAPFWKKSQSQQISSWVESKTSDHQIKHKCED